MGGFSNARTSYFHKSIAGYHAAKPKRIQNLYDFYISKNNFDVLNMLNVKYIIQNSEDNPLGVTRNPNNLGNAWFVENIINVCLLYTSPSPRDKRQSRMPSSA